MDNSFHSKDGKSDETDRTILQPPPPQTEETAATVFVAQPKQTDVNALRTARGESGRVVLKPGEQFGKYSIQRKLGEGAMGAVFLALDTTLDRQVALKVPFFREGDGREVIDRFYREARAMATVHHPNICPVFEVDDVEGVHYLTMAFIEGRPLSDFVKRKKRMPGRAVAAVMRKLAFALQEAHEKGVVHRDLKPANIMVDKRNEPIVMDFGLAQRRGSGEAELTMGGQILGSPAYMSPEQVEGDQKKVGPRSDIYALGVIMYQMLTGRLPFEGSVGAVLGKIMTQEPAPPSTLNKDVDPELESICLKCLSKSAADRYSTAGDLAEAIYLYMRRRPGGSEQTAEITRTQGRPEPVVPASAASSTNEMQALTRDLFDQLSAEEARRDTARSRRTLLVAMLLVGLLGVAGWFGWKLTDKGQILVTSYDPAAVVVVKRDGQQVDEFSIGQRPGSSSYFSGSFEVAMKPNQPVVGARVKNGVFVLVRGQVMPVEILPPDYRDVSMFVIKHRGLVFIVGEQQVAATISQLPAGEFQIERLNLVSANDGQIKQLVDKMADMKQAPDVRITASPQVTNAGVKEFARVPTIQGLGISEASVTDEGVKELANLPNLKTLELNQVPVGDQAIAAIAEKAKSLEKLVATKTNITDDSLASLKQLPNLQTLEIDSPMVTDAGIKQLAEFPALKSVEIRDNPNISAEGVAALSQMKELEHLGLAGSAIRDEHVAELAKSKTLRELDLSRTQVTDVGMIPLKDSKLEKVELAETKVSEHGAAFVQNSLINCQVDTRFTPGGKAVGVARAATEAVEAKQRQQAFADEKKMPIEFTNSIGMKFRLIPPGTFTMGSAEGEVALLSASTADDAVKALLKSEMPRHKVTLTQPYYLGTFEVTQAQFQTVMKGPIADPQKPVGMVPWNTAVDFCNKLSVSERLKPCYEMDGGICRLTADGNGYRLPTEAEWEYACRAGTSTAFSFADSAAEFEEYGWAFNLSKGPERVGLKSPNAFGLFDMYGNHWEWVEDRADRKSYNEDVTDPRWAAGKADRITRGGAYYHGAARVRSAARVPQLAHMTYPAGGFRVALAGQPPAKPSLLAGGLVPRPARRSHLAPRDEPTAKGSDPATTGSQKAHLAERDGYDWQVYTKDPRGGVSVVKWSPDRKSIAAFVPHERAVRIYDIGSNELRCILPGLDGTKELAWSPDSKQIAVLVNNGVIVGRLGESSCQPTKVFVPVEKLLRWSPDGQWLTAAIANSVLLFKPDGSDFKTCAVPGYVEDLSWSPFDPALPANVRLASPLLAVSAGNVVSLFNADGTPGPVFKDAGNRIAWHPTGRQLATPSSNNAVRVWNVDGTESVVLPDHNPGVAFSPTGQGIVTTTTSGDVYYWSPKPAGEQQVRAPLAQGVAGSPVWNSSQHLCFLDDPSGDFHSGVTVLTLAADRMSATKAAIVLPGNKGTCIDFEPRGSRFVTGVTPWFDFDGSPTADVFPDQVGRVQIHDATGAVQQRLSDQFCTPLRLAWNPRAAQLAVLLRDNTVRIYQPDGTPLRTITYPQRFPHVIDWTADGKNLVVLDELGGLEIFDDFGRSVRRIAGTNSPPRPFAFVLACHPTNPNLIALGGFSGLRLFDWRDNAAQPKDVTVDPTRRSWINALAWSRDGKFLASGYWMTDGEVQFWTENGDPVARVDTNKNQLNFLNWSPDGTSVLGSGWHYTGAPQAVLLASRTQNSLTPVIAKPAVMPRDGVFTPNGKGFAIAADDGVRLYRLDGQPGPVLEFAGDSARAIRFSPDGKQLFAAGKSGIRVWSTQTRQIDRVIVPLPNGQSRTYDPTGRVLHSTPQAAAYLTEVVEPSPGEVRLLPSPADPSAIKSDNQALRLAVGTGGELPNPGLDVLRPFTIEAFIALNDPGPLNGVLLVANNEYHIEVRNSQAHFYSFHNHVTAPTALVPRRRTHFAGVRTAEKRLLFVDGKLAASTDEPLGSKSQDTPRPLSLGRPTFDYTIDEIRISQVARYDRDFAPVERFTPDKDTLALYHCDEGGGNELKDSSGNNRHGKLVNAKWEPVVAVPPADQLLLAVAPFTAAQARAHQEAWAKQMGVTVEFENSLGMKFVLIPPGEYDRGIDLTEADLKKWNADEHPLLRASFDAAMPRHRVRITKPFYMQTHEVTVGQFRQLLGRLTTGDANAPPEMPLMSLDFFVDAVAFCNALSQREGLTSAFRTRGSETTRVFESNGYRLPTDAEWEFACRAGTTTPWFFGADPHGPRGNVELLFDHESARRGANAKPNPFGLFDLYAGSSETCYDRLQPYRPGLAVDPFEEPGDTAVARGGSTFSNGGSHIASINSFVRSSVDNRAGANLKWLGLGRVVLPVVAGKQPQPVKKLEANAKFDLLPLVDLKADALAGEWAAEDSGFVSNKQAPKDAVLRLPVVPGDEYELRASVAVQRSNISFVLPFESKGLELFFSGGRMTLCLKPLKAPTNPSGDFNPIHDGQRHELVIVVKRPTKTGVSVDVAVDGTRALEWSGTLDEIQKNTGRYAGDTAIRVGVFLPSPGCFVKLLSAQLTTPLGHAKPLRPASPDRWPLDPPDGVAYTWSQPENLGPNVNTTFFDEHPELSADGLTLWLSGGGTLWTSVRKSLDAPFEKRLSAGKINDPGSWDSEPTLSADGLTLVFSSGRGNNKKHVDLWMSTRAQASDPFGPPVRLALSTENSEGSPCLSADGLTLLFASDRSGGAGGIDLWQATRPDRSSDFGDVRNLGPEINSPSQDNGPQLSADGLTLVFHSMRPGGSGNGDLYVSIRPTRDAPFGKPVSLGPLLNTPDHEEAPCVSRDGQSLLFYSDRPNGLGKADIWLSRRVPRSPDVIDVLAQVDLARDTVQHQLFGEWKREGNALVSPGGKKAGRLVLPIRPPAEYELDAVVERLNGSDGIAFGVVVDGQPAGVNFDTFIPPVSGISLIDGKPHPQNETKFETPVLKDLKRYSIQITVGKQSVRATVDGRQVVQWNGDPRRLTCPEVAGRTSQFWFGAAYDQFKFHQLELRPLKSPPAADSATNLVYLDDLQEASWKNGHMQLGKHDLEYNGRKYQWRGKEPAHALVTHATTNLWASVAYRLDGKYDRFTAVTGIGDPAGSRNPLAFRVLGDDRELWKSKPLQNGTDEETVSVSVRGVKELKLEVHCGDDNFKAFGVWFEPRLTTTSSALRWPLAASKPDDIRWLREELKGTLTLRSGPENETVVGPNDAPPAGPATIVGLVIDRNNGPAVTDEVLKRIATLVDLESLSGSFAVPASSVTKDGLPVLAALVNLRTLTLGRIGPADTDPAFLGSLKNLESLSLQYATYTGWEAMVGRLPRLNELWLHNVDNFRAEQLGPRPRLTSLKLTGLPQTRPARDAAAKRISELAPWCRISLDNASAGDKPVIIEPTSPPPAD